MTHGIDFSIVRQSFGEKGELAVKKMHQALQNHALDIIFNSDSRKFVILGNPTLSQQAITEIFRKQSEDKHWFYNGLWPEVLDETDELGNREVRLICPDYPGGVYMSSGWTMCIARR